MRMLRSIRIPVGHLGVLLVLVVAAVSRAEAPRVLPPGELPEDRRLGKLITLNDYFPFLVDKCIESWPKRSERVRRQLLVATGLWPMPTKTPDRAVVHGSVDRDDYTVEKVFLESFPGHFVTGNLYRPKGVEGPLPGVLCPHGHWPQGRFHDAGEKKLAEEIKRGAEPFDPGGRSPLQSRCVQLARMGCLVFHYDMVGYADSGQLSHRPGNRQAMNVTENWGYFSPQAELRLQNMMGLQTYNSIRALDWFVSLPEIDQKRIGVTGASGGGTQTFMLAAVDSRPAVAVPAVMVSTAMQGGCTCENACYLRIETGNVEMAALFAPRPLGLTAADDWTKEMPTKGFPELKRLYTKLGVEDRVALWPFLQFPHNYNHVARGAMYPWMNKHLGLGLEEPIVERPYVPLSIEEMSVWDDAHPRPTGGDDYERSLLRWITDDSQKQIAALKSKEEFRHIVGGAFDVILGRSLPPPGTVTSTQRTERQCENYRILGLLLEHAEAKEQLPALLLEPKSWNGSMVVWIASDGKQSMFDDSGQPIRPIERLVSAGMAVLGVDLFGQGEFTPDGKPFEKQPLNKSGRGDWASYAGYTFGYNSPLFSRRVHDVLSTVSFARAKEGVRRVDLVGLNGAGHWVAAARAQAAAAVDRAVVDTAGFRFASLTSLDHVDFLPGAAKYLDLPGLLALSAPHELWLTGEGLEPPDVIVRAYQAQGAHRCLTFFDGDCSKSTEDAVEWLLRRQSAQNKTHR